MVYKSHSTYWYSFKLVPSGYPQNFTGLATTPRSAVLTWEPPPEDQQNGIIVEYTVDISVANTGQIFQLHTSATSLTLSTLLPYRTYFFLIRAATVVGQGPPSTTMLQLTTPEDGKLLVHEYHYS